MDFANGCAKEPAHLRFLAPQNMPDAIDAYLLEYGQAPLAAPAGFARCIMESLVLRYRKVFQQISHLTGAIIKQVHVVGGGARTRGSTSGWLTLSGCR